MEESWLWVAQARCYVPCHSKVGVLEWLGSGVGTPLSNQEWVSISKRLADTFISRTPLGSHDVNHPHNRCDVIYSYCLSSVGLT